jgi:exopolysaccharide biosynthesis polyprenyl glycosylphosphotransferase
VRRVVLLTALKLFDLASVVVCYGAAWMLVVGRARVTGADDLLSLEIRVADLMLALALLGVWHLVFLMCGVYDSKRLSSRWSEIGGIVRATATAAAVVFLPSLLFRSAPAENLVIGAAFFAAVCSVAVTSRLALRWFLGVIRRRGRNLRHLLIVGTNRRALAFARRLEDTPELGYRILGFLDSREWDASGGFERSGHPLVGGVGDLPAILRRQVVDEVLVFLPLKSFYELGARIVRQCEEQGIRVTLPSSMFELTTAQATAQELEADPVVTIATRTITGGGAFFKRVIDVVSAAVLLVALAPLLLGVALVIKLTSPGPVLFSQERVGLNKRRFRMLKFRTMVADAERRMREVEHLNEASGPVFKIRNDPRVTRVGAVLRKTSIDELPQLLNVLTGDLSLVGPRPLPVRDYEGFDKDPHRRRFSVRPGITCLWQIGGRSDVSFERWMELDMEYIDNWSLWLDLKILFKTIPVVLRGTGAA